MGFLYRVHVLLKDDLLSRMIEALGLQPAKVGLGPATAPGVDPAVALQEAVQPLAHAALGVLEVFPAALQVAHRLLRFVGHPHGRQLAVLEKPHQRQRIAPVGLDAVARPPRNQRGRHHRAGVPQGCELTVDAVAAGTGLVAKPQRGPTTGQLGRQLGQRGARRRYRSIQVRPLSAFTGQGDGDRIFMYVQGDEFRRFTHGLLLLAGDRSLGELRFPKDNPRQPKSEEVFHIPVNTRAARWRRRRIIYNNDGDDVIATEKKSGDNLTLRTDRELMDDFLDARTRPLVGTQVDSNWYCSCMAGVRFSHRTRLGGFHGEGIPLELVERYGRDSLQIQTDFSHDNNMEAFWSLRMNDCHDAHPMGTRRWTYGLAPFKRDHPEFLMGEPGDWDKYEGTEKTKWTCLDFSFPEVREHIFSIIEEVARNYDLDGMELDFFRHFPYFRPSRERLPWSPGTWT